MEHKVLSGREKRGENKEVGGKPNGRGREDPGKR